MAGSDDAPSRAAIMLSAARKAGAKHGLPILYCHVCGRRRLGHQSCAKFRLGFIGIASGDGAEQLRRAGAAMVLPNFSPSEEFSMPYADGRSVVGQVERDVERDGRETALRVDDSQLVESFDKDNNRCM